MGATGDSRTRSQRHGRRRCVLVVGWVSFQGNHESQESNEKRWEAGSRGRRGGRQAGQQLCSLQHGQRD